MSSLLVLQDKDNVIMASDTASSVRINSISYRVSDSEKKIFDLNGYKVFASGQMHIRDLFINMSKNEGNNFTPILAEEILKKYFLGIDEYCLEVVIAEKLEDSTVLYFLSSYNDFIIEKNISSTKEISAFAAGIQTRDIMNTFESKYIQTHKLVESIIESYNSNQTEEVGGSVEIHQVGSVSPPLLHKLDDISVKRAQSNSSEHLIIGERIIGKLILGTQLMAEDENGIIRIRGSLQEVFNKQGAVQVALGEFTQGRYGLRVNQGAIEIIGGLTRSNLSQEVRDTLAGADGIRGDLRMTAPLPTNLTLNSLGITATATGDPNRFARLDYRGLYAQNGAIDIRTGSSTNRGVLIDGNGIRAYDTFGTKKFDISSNGNAMFAGTLEAASGSFTGRLSAASGSFSGDITGSNGTFYGALSSGSITSSTITGGTISGTTITGNTISGGTISGTTISGTTVSGGTVSGSTITGGTISGTKVTSATIDIYESASIGEGLYLRGPGNYTGIYFGSAQIMQDASGYLNLSNRVSIGNFTEFHGSVDFSRANVTGLGASGGTTVRYSATSNRLYVDLNGVQQGYVNVI